MNTGLTETQENLLDRVARASRKIFLRRMMISANKESEEQKEKDLQEIKDILLGYGGKLDSIHKDTQNVSSTVKSWKNSVKQFVKDLRE